MTDAVPQRILFVHAHPDDESIVTGGMIATWVAQGRSVGLVTCTRGERGEVIPEALQHLREDRGMLAKQRSAELGAALDELGLTEHWWLGELAGRTFTDSGMQWGPDGTPQPVDDVTEDAWTKASIEEGAGHLTAIVERFAPEVLVTYCPNGGYGHPDHVQTHHVVMACGEATGIPVWWIASRAYPANVEVDVSEHVGAKTAALAAHLTQIVVDGERFCLDDGVWYPIDAIEGLVVPG